MAATLKDIAAHLGITVATVSRALRDPHRHSRELTERIRRAASELGYDPDLNNAARRLALGRSGKRTPNKLAALALPEDFYQTPYFLRTFEGALDRFSAAGFGLVVLKATRGGGSKVPPYFQRGDVDAFLCYPPGERLITALRADPGFGDRPIIALQEEAPSHGLHLVTADFADGAAQLLHHLWALGHRRLAYLHKDTNYRRFCCKHGQQVAGFQRAFAELGVPLEKHLSFAPMGKTHWAMSFRVNRQAVDFADLVQERAPLLTHLEKHPDTTAVIAPNDHSAELTCQILERSGWRIPADLSVTGFDDYAPPVGWEPPTPSRLTTVRLPLREIGEAAAEVALELMAKPETSEAPLRTVTLPVTLVPRQSTGPARTGRLRP